MEGIQESRDFISMTGLDSLYVPERERKLDSFVDPETRAKKLNLFQERVFETTKAGSDGLRLGMGNSEKANPLQQIPAITIGSLLIGIGLIPVFIGAVVSLVAALPAIVSTILNKLSFKIWRFRPLKLVEFVSSTVMGWILVPGLIIMSAGLAAVDGGLRLYHGRDPQTRRLGLDQAGGRSAIYKKLLFPIDTLKQFYEKPKKKDKKGKKGKSKKGGKAKRGKK